MKRYLTRVLLFMLVLAAASCSSDPDIIGVDNLRVPSASVVASTKHKIFITTTRQRSNKAATFFSGHRGSGLALASVVVSVPPNHKAGVIERPKRIPPDPMREFTITEPETYGERDRFIAEINDELAKRPPDAQDVLLFVHGYNNTLSDSVLRVAQFVEDSGFKGIPVLFSWASAGEKTKYVYDLNSALAARPLIEDASSILIRTNAKGFNVFAHSMGTLLVMEVMVQSDLQGTLGESGHLNNIMLAAPDIDVDLFRSQLSQIRNRPGNLFIYTSRDDHALKLSRKLSGGVDRVGNATYEELASLGVTVFDLSDIRDSSSGSHAKFAGSPEVVQLIGRSLHTNNFGNDAGTPSLVEVVEGVPVLRELVQ